MVLFASNALFVDDDSKLHIWVGYTILGLVGLRIVWGFIGTRRARFSDFPPSLSAGIQQLMEMATWRKHIHIGHSPLGALMVYNLLLALLVIGLSGYLMTTDMFWGVEWPEEMHEVAVAWAEISVVAHVAAVIFESRRLGVNLPRSMVTGYKTIETPQNDV